MMDLSILILVEVKANDVSSNSFHSSLLTISFNHPFKLDSVHKSFSFWFEEKIEKCKKLRGENPSLHALCVVGGFYHCVWDMHPMDPLHGMVENVELLYLKEYREHITKNKANANFFDIGKCLV